MSPHTDAHADAPMHYASGEAAIGGVDLRACLGPYRLIHCLDCGPVVQPAHIAPALENLPARLILRMSRAASQS